jgi:hypothetical protein
VSKNPGLGQYVDGSQGALTMDQRAARTLAQDHPKSAVPPPHRPGMALDGPGESEASDQPRSGVGGALPIGAFQS